VGGKRGEGNKWAKKVYNYVILLFYRSSFIGKFIPK